MFDFFSSMQISSDSFSVLDDLLTLVKHLLIVFGSLVILTGSLFVVFQFIYRFFYKRDQLLLNFDLVRLGLTRSIILGLEFIIAADVIQTTKTPDFYAVGMLAAVSLIRAFLNYSLNKDLTAISEREQKEREEMQS